MSICIALDSPSGEYIVGELISGTVYIRLAKPKTIRKVAVDFKGREKCQWTKTATRQHNGKTEHYTVSYWGKRKLFDYRLILLEGPGEFVLPAGEHTYRFEHFLPTHLPANLEGSLGHIRYYLKGFVDIPLTFDYTCKTPFTVIPILDLNTSMLARQPFVFEAHKTIGALCCTSGHIRFTAFSPKCGFTSLEVIPFDIHIENFSSAEIYETEIEIEKSIKYFAQHPRSDQRTEHFTVAKQKWDTKLPPRSGEQSFSLTLTVLPTQPSTLDETAVIKIGYKVEITCGIRGMHTNISGKVPIVIGSIPVGQRGGNVRQVTVVMNPGEVVEQQQTFVPGKPPTAPAGDIGWKVEKTALE